MVNRKAGATPRRKRNEEDDADGMLENEQDIEELKKLVEEARTNRPKDIKKKMKKLAKAKKQEEENDDDDIGGADDNEEDEEASDEERVLRELKAEASRNGEESEDDVKNGTSTKSNTLVNDSAILKQIASELCLSDFAESLQLTDVVINQEKINPEDDKIREALFQDCATRSVKAARAKLDELKIPHRRPTDFMAEMIKSDDHMARVKRRLLFEQQKMKVVEARKAAQRNKKRGKEIKKQKEQEKASRKRQAAEIATSFREKDDLNDRSSKKMRPISSGQGGKGKGKGASRHMGGAKKRLGKNKRNSSRGKRK